MKKLKSMSSLFIFLILSLFPIGPVMAASVVETYPAPPPKKLVTNNFEGYNGSGAPAGISPVYSQGGYYGVNTIDSAHGKSFILGINNPPVSGQADGAWAGIPMSVPVTAGMRTGKKVISFDAYIDAYPNAGKNFRLEFDGRNIPGTTGGLTQQFLLIRDNGKMDIYSEAQPNGYVTGTPAVSFNYQIKTWYHFEIRVDADYKKYGVKITDTSGTVKAEISASDGGILGSQPGILNIRVFTPSPVSSGVNPTATFMAMDNLTVDDILTPNPKFTVSVKAQGQSVWQDSFVYDIIPRTMPYINDGNANETVVPAMPFTYFGLDGAVTIKVTSTDEIGSPKIKPLNNGITYTKTSDYSIEFTIDSPQNLCVELSPPVKGTIKQPSGLLDYPTPPEMLLIYANPLENPPDPNDPNIVYFEPGITNIPANSSFNNNPKLQLSNNKTYYIAGGAVVRGSLYVNHGQNITVRGPGVFINTDYGIGTANHYAFFAGDTSTQNNNLSHDITVSDCIFANINTTWSVVLRNQTYNVNFNNVKIMSNRKDGLDIDGVKSFTADNCFIMSADDSLALKSSNFSNYGNNSIIVKNTSLANMAGGNAIAIGYETATNYPMSNILFENIDILYSLTNTDNQRPDGNWCEAVFAVTPRNQTPIVNVTYDTIRVEEFFDDYIFLLRIWDGGPMSPHRVDSQGQKDGGAAGLPQAQWTPTHLGLIDNIVFKHIYVNNLNGTYTADSFARQELLGFISGCVEDSNGSLHKVSNVSFYDIVIDGNRIKSAADGLINIGNYTENINFYPHIKDIDVTYKVGSQTVSDLKSLNGGEELNVSATIKSDTADSFSAWLIAALYKNNQLIDVTVSNEINAANGEKMTMTATNSINIPQNISSGDYSIKVFVCDKENLYPWQEVPLLHGLVE